MSAGAPPSSQFSKDVEGGSAKDDGCAEIDVDGKKHDDTDDGYDDPNRLNCLPAFRGLLSDNWVTVSNTSDPITIEPFASVFITETGLPVGWTQVSADCTINGEPFGGTEGISAQPGDAVVCTFTNEFTPPQPTLTLVISSPEGFDVLEFLWRNDVTR